MQDEWSPEGGIMPMLEAPEIASGDELTPRGVLEREQLINRMLRNAADPSSAAGLAGPLDKPSEAGTPSPVAAQPLTRAQQDWLELFDRIDTGVRHMLQRRPVEGLQLMQWLHSLGTKRPSPLLVALDAPSRISFTVNAVAQTAVGELVVFVLPGEASDIQMEMGSRLRFTFEGQDRQGLFISCYRLEGFPFKFLQLGIDPHPTEV